MRATRRPGKCQGRTGRKVLLQRSTSLKKIILSRWSNRLLLPHLFVEGGKFGRRKTWGRGETKKRTLYVYIYIHIWRTTKNENDTSLVLFKNDRPCSAFARQQHISIEGIPPAHQIPLHRAQRAAPGALPSPQGQVPPSRERRPAYPPRRAYRRKTLRKRAWTSRRARLRRPGIHRNPPERVDMARPNGKSPPLA